jgi:hypothetical protein
VALVVENNTGLANADSYVSLVEFQAWFAARGLEVDLTDAEQEAKLRLAFDYVNANWAYKSSPVSNDQAGEFPRVDLSDGSGRVTSNVPKRVKDAQCYAAFYGATEDLFVVAERGGQVASEAVGPISTSYFAGAPAATLFAAVEKMLACFVKDGAAPRRPEPQFNDYDDTDPVFSVGMDDNPGWG